MKELDGIGVMRRPLDAIDLDALGTDLPGLVEKVHFVDAPLLDIASQDIRERVRKGAPYRYYVHSGVYQVIEDAGLYRS